MPGLRKLAVLADANNATVRRLTHCGRQRAPAVSSFQFSKSPRATTSQRPWKRPGIGRYCAQRFGVTDALRQSSPDYGANRGAAIPAIYQWPEAAETGRLCRLWAAPDPARSRASCPTGHPAPYGVKVADIPVEQPSKFELVINLKTAKATRVDGSGVVLGSSRQGDRIAHDFCGAVVAVWPFSDVPSVPPTCPVSEV